MYGIVNDWLICEVREVLAKLTVLVQTDPEDLMVDREEQTVPEAETQLLDRDVDANFLRFLYFLKVLFFNADSKLSVSVVTPSVCLACNGREPRETFAAVNLSYLAVSYDLAVDLEWHV